MDIIPSSSMTNEGKMGTGVLELYDSDGYLRAE